MDADVFLALWSRTDDIIAFLFQTDAKCGEQVSELLAGSAAEKADVWQGTLALMVLKTLHTMGPQHGYGIAPRIERTSAHQLVVNYGTLYPALLKLEQEGYIASEWGLSDRNRKAKYYQLTRAGRKQLETETQEWEQMTAILARFLSPKKGYA